MDKITVTRHSKLGWDYCTTPTDNDPWSIKLPSKPHHIGTYAQVRNAIKDDTSYQLDKQSCYYTAQWWVRVNRKWVAIDDTDLWLLDWETSVEVDVKG